VDGNEFLQTSHFSDAQHCPFPSSKRQAGILGVIIQPASSFLTVRVPDYLHCDTAGTQFVGHDDNWISKALH
jgi:hypothetical protein